MTGWLWVLLVAGTACGVVGFQYHLQANRSAQNNDFAGALRLVGRARMWNRAAIATCLALAIVALL